MSAVLGKAWAGNTSMFEHVPAWVLTEADCRVLVAVLVESPTPAPAGHFVELEHVSAQQPEAGLPLQSTFEAAGCPGSGRVAAMIVLTAMRA